MESKRLFKINISGMDRDVLIEEDSVVASRRGSRKHNLAKIQTPRP